MRKYTKAFEDWYGRAETVQHLQHWQEARVKWLCFKAWNKSRQLKENNNART